uniref:Uncharacterized protein n=1 Tax=Cacopsylla melanoneura TaxID=428564 RepID=A0A8D8SJH0_9HEMI
MAVFSYIPWSHNNAYQRYHAYTLVCMVMYGRPIIRSVRGNCQSRVIFTPHFFVTHFVIFRYATYFFSLSRYTYLFFIHIPNFIFYLTCFLKEGKIGELLFFLF